VVNDQRAYYLLGFEPPKAAFEKSSGRPKFHEIKLKVNRPDLRIRRARVSTESRTTK
jgi:hypothetical protein